MKKYKPTKPEITMPHKSKKFLSTFLLGHKLWISTKVPFHCTLSNDMSFFRKALPYVLLAKICTSSKMSTGCNVASYNYRKNTIFAAIITIQQL